MIRGSLLIVALVAAFWLPAQAIKCHSCAWFDGNIPLDPADCQKSTSNKYMSDIPGHIACYKAWGKLKPRIGDEGNYIRRGSLSDDIKGFPYKPGCSDAPKEFYGLFNPVSNANLTNVKMCVCNTDGCNSGTASGTAADSSGSMAQISVVTVAIIVAFTKIKS